MALAADIVLAVPDAEFALPEMQRGLVPDAGAVQRLARKFPYNVAVELMLTGRKMSAREAAQWGFVNAVVSCNGAAIRSAVNNDSTRDERGSNSAFGIQ